MTPDHPSWATMPKGTPSSTSSSPSDDLSLVSSSKTRKRKISTQVSQNGKRPKLGQSATQPVPKRSAKGKGKQRNESEGTGTNDRDWSPGQEVDAVQATQSARAQASTSVSASASTSQVPTRRKKERARKSTGTMKAPLSSSARTGKRPSLSSASASQARRHPTPQVNGHTLDISDEEPQIAPPIGTLSGTSHLANVIDLTLDDGDEPVGIISLLSSDEEDSAPAANPAPNIVGPSIGKPSATLRSPAEASASTSAETIRIPVSHIATLDEKIVTPTYEPIAVDLHPPASPSPVISRARSLSTPPPAPPVQDPSPVAPPPKLRPSPFSAVPSQTNPRRSSLSDTRKQKGSSPTPSNLFSATQPVSGTSTKQGIKLPAAPTLPAKLPVPPLARRHTQVIAEPFLPPVPAPNAPDWGRRSSHNISRARISGTTVTSPLKPSLQLSRRSPHPASSSSSNSKPPPSPQKEVDASNVTRSVALATSSQATTASTRPATASTSFSASLSPSKLLPANHTPIANADAIPESPSKSPVDLVSRAANMSDHMLHRPPSPQALPHTASQTDPASSMVTASKSVPSSVPKLPRSPAIPKLLNQNEGKSLADVINDMQRTQKPEVIDLTSDLTSDDSDDEWYKYDGDDPVGHRGYLSGLMISDGLMISASKGALASNADTANSAPSLRAIETSPKKLELIPPPPRTTHLASLRNRMEQALKSRDSTSLPTPSITQFPYGAASHASHAPTHISTAQAVAPTSTPSLNAESKLGDSDAELPKVPAPPRVGNRRPSLSSKHTSSSAIPAAHGPSNQRVSPTPRNKQSARKSTGGRAPRVDTHAQNAFTREIPSATQAGSVYTPTAQAEDTSEDSRSEEATLPSISNEGGMPSHRVVPVSTASAPSPRGKQTANKSTGRFAPRVSTRGIPSATQAGLVYTPTSQVEDTVEGSRSGVEPLYSVSNEGDAPSHPFVPGDSSAVNSLTIEVDSLSMSGACEDTPMVVDGDDSEHPMSVFGPSSPNKTVSAIDEDRADEDRPKGRPPAFEEDDEDGEVYNLVYPPEAELDHPSQSSASTQSLSRPASTPPLSAGTSSRSRRSISARSASRGPLPSTSDVADDSHMGDYQTPVDDYITFERVREAARQLPAPYLLAKDLPHTLQDQMNRLPAMYRKHQDAVGIFEASIRESSAVDDPGAPPISIINPIEDDDEATPPWEFHYTNSLWHGEGVPAPDLKSLQGCDCHGVCNPKSKSCACVKKQSKWYDDEGRQPGFAYHTSKSMQGRLQQPQRQYPIFECNQFCSCDEACGNRVVQHGRKCEVNIVKTKQKGWGVFAGSKRIPAGTFIGIYTGELLLNSVSEERGRKYNVFGRTYLFDVDGYQIGQTLGLPEGEYEAAYVIDAYHAGNFTRFLNHACEPNCMILCCYINEGDIERPLLTIFSMVDIEPYEELSFSYSGAPDDTEVEAAVKAVNGDVPSVKAAVYAKCCCGAPSCKGIMFK